jgi:hypothetical protein
LTAFSAFIPCRVSQCDVLDSAAALAAALGIIVEPN